jgi:hypothetical protein
MALFNQTAFNQALAAPMQNVSPTGFNQSAFDTALTTPMQDVNPAGFNQTAINQAIGTGAGAVANQLGAAAPSGFDLGGLLGGAAQLGSTFYQNKENLDRLRQLGIVGQAEATRVGQEALGASSFKPFSVTTGAGTTTTTPTGGFDLGLSPEQAAMQAQLTQQAGGLFGGITGDAGQAGQDIYNQIRAIQDPEEQRAQLRLNEELFARGRGGISSAQFGGQGAEQFGFNKAQQEAMNQAAFQARQQALGEQQQQLALGQGLLGQAYVPQQQQLDALDAGTNLSNIANTGARTGATLQAQLGSAGIEALLAASQQAATAQAARDQSYSNLLLGSGSGINATGGLLTGGSGVEGALGSAVGLGDAPTPQWIKDLGNDAKKWLGI